MTMDLTTYTGLQAAIASYLNRDDLTASIPGFIALGEAEMRRRLRDDTVVATMSIAAASNAVPAGCKELRSVKLVTSSTSIDVPLRLGTKEQLDEKQASLGPVARPQVAAFLAGVLYVAPTPDQTYTAEIAYYTVLSALSGSVASNWILVAAPDAYLYGALLHSAPFLEHDERVPLWRDLFDAAMLSVEIQRDNREFGASLKEMRLPRQF